MGDVKAWVKSEFRRRLPHSSFLATFGRLYHAGSVPTHRIAVDFPLHIIEELKNNIGALDDPMMYDWFRNERLKYIDLRRVKTSIETEEWTALLRSYGFRSILIHGHLERSRRRFTTIQLMNPFDGGSPEVAHLVSDIVGSIAKAGWSIIDHRVPHGPKKFVGHPTLGLTATELEIVELIAQGLSNKEIARRRGVSDSTVKTQVQRTGAKLGATRRAEIVAIAMPMLSQLPPQTLTDYDSDF